MKKITIIKKPGIALKQAQDEAINQGYNCYSKPHGKDLWDYATDDKEVFYFSKNLVVLEVTVKKEPIEQPTILFQ